MSSSTPFQLKKKSVVQNETQAPPLQPPQQLRQQQASPSLQVIHEELLKTQSELKQFKEEMKRDMSEVKSQLQVLFTMAKQLIRQ